MTDARKFRVGDQVRVRLPQAPVMAVLVLAAAVRHRDYGEYETGVLCAWFDARVLELVEAAE